ncbi:MAG: lytic transglycosylase domain-containing protein [Deltaproteobacteria bacterium]|jgi:soluble lytic murein transglycosylase-like protein|nr:lytic transglycosylase domain-containing protein [Deltaproteobacteria bacterium]
MINYKANACSGATVIKASLTIILIILLASIGANLEHKARLALVEGEQLILVAEAPQTPPPATQTFTAELKPNPYILDQIKEQTHQKPLFDKKSARYEAMIEDAARLHRISPALVKAVIQAESRFDYQAVSAQGAVGLMQILPSTARSVGVHSPLEPKNNITAGVRYLKQLLDEFRDDEYLALAAYNCGPEAIKRYGGKMPPFRETRSFVTQVMRYYQSHIES